ncbi:P22 phage major capsid protein family protein [Kitasatospora sp. McL0602]|uniref:P22 phage major capsid protein family protein n=1 Tax=Kitasatospora sp. McL0602 TaxID=3439530 RepID=UPI003F8A115F
MSDNKFEIDSVVAVSLEMMRAKSVLGETVMRDAENGFTGGRGDTVRVRAPKRRTATDYSGTTVYTKVEEGAVQVKLTGEPTDAVKLDTRDMTLDVESYSRQVLAPQMDAVSKYVEKTVIADALNKAATKDAREIDPTAKPGDKGHVIKLLTAAAADFTRREIPAEGRFLAVGPDIQNVLLDVELLQQVNTAGDPAALRNATMGDLFGFRVVVSPYLTGAVAYHKTAFALAVRSPQVPIGGATGRTATDNGYAVRVVNSFDASVKSDVSIVDTLCGVATVDAERYIPFKLKAA